MKNKLILLMICFLVVISYLQFDQIKVQAVGNDLPRVVVKSYEVEHESISPGEDCKITIVLENTHASMAAYGVLLTYTSGNPNVFTKYGNSNQVYVDTISPNSDAVIEIYITSTEDLDATMFDLNLNLQYKDNLEVETSSDTIISIPVKDEILSLKRVSMPQEITLGGKTRVSVTCENNSSEDAYNAVMIIVNGENELERSELGTILNGGRKSPEVYIDLKELGQQNIIVRLEYEDAQGQKYIKESPGYKVTVSKDAKSEEESQDISDGTSESNTSFSGKQLGYLGCMGVFSVGAVILWFRKKD